MTHLNCVLDGSDAYQANIVRGHRLMVATIHDDDDAAELVITELQGCAPCHAALTRMLAAVATRFLRKVMGETVAIKMLEMKLSDTIDELRPSQGGGGSPISETT